MHIFEESLNRFIKNSWIYYEAMILIMQVRLSVFQLKKCMIGFYIMK